MGGVLHADGHDGAIEIGAEADVIDAGDFDGVIDVVDDGGPIDFGKLACLHEIADDLIAGDQCAGFVFAAALFHFGVDFLFSVGMGCFEIAEFLAEKADVVIDLDDATVSWRDRGSCRRSYCARRCRGRGRKSGRRRRGFADGENIVKSFVGNVGDIDDDAEAIHFADDILAEIGEAVVCGLVGGGIGPIVIFHVREGHVANAESGEGSAGRRDRCRSCGRLRRP